MIDKRILKFIILIFVIFNGIIFLEIVLKPSHQIKMTGSSTMRLYSSNQDHTVQVTLNVKSLNGTVYVEYNDWDARGTTPIHIGKNVISQTTPYLDLVLIKGSSITGSYVIQDTGPYLDIFFLIFLVPLLIIYILMLVIIVNYDIPNDINKIGNFIFIMSNITLMIAFLNYKYNVPSFRYIFFSGLSIIQLIYSFILIFSYITFLLAKIKNNQEKHIKMIRTIFLILGLILIVYSSLLCAGAIPIQFFGHFNYISYFVALTSLFFLIIGYKIITIAILIDEPSVKYQTSQ